MLLEMFFMRCGIHTLYTLLQYQRTALHYASEGGHHDTLRVLLERGADPNTKDWVSMLKNNVHVRVCACIKELVEENSNWV